MPAYVLGYKQFVKEAEPGCIKAGEEGAEDGVDGIGGGGGLN